MEDGACRIGGQPHPRGGASATMKFLWPPHPYIRPDGLERQNSAQYIMGDRREYLSVNSPELFFGHDIRFCH